MIDYEQFPLLAEDPVDSATTPSYIKIYDIIFDLIAKNELKTGDVIPSANTLAAHWDVSRGTVRIAMRKLEEDGYINQAQGKQAMVAAYAYQTRNGLHWINNLCIENCLDTIDKTKVKIDYQACGSYVAHELGREKAGFLVLAVTIDYYAKGSHVANTVTIFDAQHIEEFNLDITNRNSIKEFVMGEIYQYAKRTKTTFNVMNVDEDTIINVSNPEESLIIFEEVLLDEQDKHWAYCKMRLRASKYRFLIDRKSPI